MPADDINERIGKPEDFFHFILKRALEPENHPNTANKLRIQTGALQREKKEWLEYCREKLREEEPIERYCYAVRGIVPEYDLSFEEYLKDEQEAANIKRDRMQRFSNEIDSEAFGFFHKKPDGMTNKQWIEEKRKRKRLSREERNQEEADRMLERQSPIYMFRQRVDKIGCRCEAEEIRRGIFCETCKLIRKVNEYMLNLFKNTSQGRTAF